MLSILLMAAACFDEEDVLEKNDSDDVVVLITLELEEGTDVHLHLEDDNYFEKMTRLTMLFGNICMLWARYHY